MLIIVVGIREEMFKNHVGNGAYSIHSSQRKEWQGPGLIFPLILLVTVNDFVVFHSFGMKKDSVFFNLSRIMTLNTVHLLTDNAPVHVL